MSLLGAVGNFLGMGKPAEKIIDAGADAGRAIAAGVDAMFFTDEEKSRATQEAWNTWLDHQRMVLGESSIRSITRRKLAVGVIQTYMFLVVAAAVVWKIDAIWAVHIIECIKLISLITGAVVAFYFGPYMIGRELLNKKKDK